MVYKKLIKNPTLADFIPIIPWNQIKYVLGKRRYTKFRKWMRGKTTMEDGVYESDLDRFLKTLPVID